VEGAVPVCDEAVTVGRVHEALGNIFGDGGQILVEVVEVPPDRRRRTLIQTTSGLAVVAIRGGGDWEGSACSAMILPSYRW